MRRWRSGRPSLRWASAALAPLVIGGSPATATPKAAAEISLLVLVLALLRLAPWTAKR